MDPKYDAKTLELKWRALFDKPGFFSPDEKTGVPYTVMMPPPNVTGVLHNGHALFVTLQDILVRYHRMKGRKTLWLPGTDHAGIATQTVVEREVFKQEGKTRHEIGRPEFVKKIWQWVDQNGKTIVHQMKQLGASADWNRHKFTLDPELCEAVNEAFVRLWDEGLIYRGERLVNWDPGSQTALSDEEVEHVARTGELFHFAYPIIGLEEEIVVATTRPETMLGDTAIAVHPDDPRYKHLQGRQVRHPFFESRVIPIIADTLVDVDFGTGAVKMTPAHDPNDYAAGKRHGLAEISIFTRDGKVNHQGGSYQGLTRQEARSQIKKDLEALGLVRGAQSIEHKVSVSSRSGEDIEPMLSKQYFIRMDSMAQKAYQAVENGETRILPASWKKTYDHFLLNIQDWCISRQLWWGHPIPVYYDLQKLGDRDLNSLSDAEMREISVASREDLVKKFGPERYRQEEDVLDTWFSSALWPFSTLGWPHETSDLKTFYPTSVLETGFDILFFWVARMMMFGLHFMGQVPFRDIYLHAMVRDAHGRKMSKSLGNAIDPIDVIEGISLEDLLVKTKNYPVPPKMLNHVLEGLKKDYPDGIPASGADGLRLSLAMLSGQGQDVKLAIPRVSGYRAFLNKVWNATRFVLMRIGPEPILPLTQVQELFMLEDRFILSRLQQVIEQVDKSLSHYEFSVASDALYQFFWTEVCDWYIELAKIRMDSPAVRSILVELVSTSVRLLHPFCPFVSEEIWSHLPGTEGTCSFASFPVANRAYLDPAAEKSFAQLQEVIGMIRNARQESNLPAQKRLSAVILAEQSADLDFLAEQKEALLRLALLDSVDFRTRQDYTTPRFAATHTNGLYDIVLPLEGLLDLATETRRLQKELEKITQERKGLEQRLQSPGFIAKAPVEILEQYRKQQSLLAEREGQISDSLNRLKNG
ncbi:MAG: valine--tRNA ligase [Myxococcaceae bacterium]|nr:valine--tRNA ligase [Myxococcaceae bacterium]MBH2005897.1 valine--tRNA ligase [Myxococcaceae bacterium]